MTQYHTGGRLSQSAWISIEGHWNFVRLWFSCCLAYLVFAVKLLKSRRISFCLLVFQATGFGTQTQSKADKTAKSSVSQSNGFLSTAPKWGHPEFRFVIIVTYLLSKLQLITCFLYLLLFYLIILPFLLRYLENLNGVQKGRNVEYEGLMKRFLFCFKPSTSAWDEKKKKTKNKNEWSQGLFLCENTPGSLPPDETIMVVVSQSSQSFELVLLWLPLAPEDLLQWSSSVNQFALFSFHILEQI